MKNPSIKKRKVFDLKSKSQPNSNSKAKDPLRVALAQINTTLGDFPHNLDKILDFIRRASEQRCQLVIFPELALFGYLTTDLLERIDLVEDQLRALKKIERQLPPGICAVVGLVTKNSGPGKPYRNSAAVLEKGKKTKIFSKELLPSYDVFDDTRFFESSRSHDNVFVFRGQKILVTVCEDIWGWEGSSENTAYPSNPLLKLKSLNIDLVLNLSASPFSLGHWERRKNTAAKTARALAAPLVYVNMVGGQDELIFDGGSFVLDRTGAIIARSLFYEEDLNVVDLSNRSGFMRELISSEPETLYKALVLGLRDFVRKTGFQKVHLGFSGGIDSALVGALAVDALGPQHVTAIALPGPFSSQESFDLAEKMAQNLGCRFLSMDVNSSYQAFLKSFYATLGESDFGVMNENLQARLRGCALMAYANQFGSLLLSTSNKSEIATGYATIYGDMCGGLAPIGDLLKTQIYKVSEFLNLQQEIIPEAILKRAPSAELRPNQKDLDSLPPYKDLDKAIVNLVIEKRAPRNSVEKWLWKSMTRSEFKRWQSPPVLRLSQKAFGRGRRYPLAASLVR